MHLLWAHLNFLIWHAHWCSPMCGHNVVFDCALCLLWVKVLPVLKKRTASSMSVQTALLPTDGGVVMRMPKAGSKKKCCRMTTAWHVPVCMSLLHYWFVHCTAQLATQVLVVFFMLSLLFSIFSVLCVSWSMLDMTTQPVAAVDA